MATPTAMSAKNGGNNRRLTPRRSKSQEFHFSLPVQRDKLVREKEASPSLWKSMNGTTTSTSTSSKSRHLIFGVIALLLVVGPARFLFQSSHHDFDKHEQQQQLPTKRSVGVTSNVRRNTVQEEDTSLLTEEKKQEETSNVNPKYLAARQRYEAKKKQKQLRQQLIENENESGGSDSISTKYKQAIDNSPLQSTPITSTTIMMEPLQCHCPTPTTQVMDPCSNPQQSLEEWLLNYQPRRKRKTKFSKNKPICPQAARHNMHILMPFSSSNLNATQFKTGYCSVACQEYPSHLLNIYLYDDGTPYENTLLHAVCSTNKNRNHIVDKTNHIKYASHNPIRSFTPPVSLDQMAQDQRTDKEFDQQAQEWAHQIMRPNDNENVNNDDIQTNNVTTYCLHSREHSGPGGAKYWAMRLVQANTNANDVVVVVDGDDQLYSYQALQIINDKYVDHAAWVTYGSMVGKYSEQMKAVPRAYIFGETPFEPRRNKPSWRFGHPRTFKAHLLSHLQRRDFAHSDGTWLVKATDRGFVYRIMEVAGLDCVKFIDTPIYKYNWSPATSTQVTIPKALQTANLEHVQQLPESKRQILPVHVIIVCWSRVFLLHDQLRWLQEQTLAQTRPIVVHLLSNNPDTHADVQNATQVFQRQTQPQMLSLATGSHKRISIDIQVFQATENWHAFSRFLHVQEMRRQMPLDYVFFLDDDQYWAPNYLESLLELHQPKSMTTWYGKNFDFAKRNLTTGLASYWNSSISWGDVILQAKPDQTSFTYGGPGGSIYDANLWLFDQQLLRLKTDLVEFYEFDDVWSSYVLDALLGWTQRRLQTIIPVDIANCHHEYYNRSLFPRLPEGQPAQLRKLNEELTNRLLAVATFTAKTNTKTDMFHLFQQKYRWDVFRQPS